MKTGALFAYAAEAGAILAGSSGEDRDRLRRYGAHFGAAFQLADDLDDAAQATVPPAVPPSSRFSAGRGRRTAPEQTS